MKMIKIRSWTLALAFLAWGVFCPQAQAQWGSLHGNNHAAPPSRPAPSFHPEPPRPEPARPAPARPEPPRPEPGRPAFHPGPAPASGHPVLGNPGAEADRRRMDIDAARHQNYFWSSYHAGMRFDHLPDGYRRFGWHGHDYFFFGGVFYDTCPGGYVVAQPPYGLDIPDMPDGADTVQGPGDATYYYAGGIFYAQQGDGYVVIAPPMGVTVSYLPPGAVATYVNGETYYVAYGVWYQPIFENGVTVYQTVPPLQT